MSKNLSLEEQYGYSHELLAFINKNRANPKPKRLSNRNHSISFLRTFNAFDKAFIVKNENDPDKLNLLIKPIYKTGANNESQLNEIEIKSIGSNEEGVSLKLSRFNERTVDDLDNLLMVSNNPQAALSSYKYLKTLDGPDFIATLSHDVDQNDPESGGQSTIDQTHSANNEADQYMDNSENSNDSSNKEQTAYEEQQRRYGKLERQEEEQQAESDKKDLLNAASKGVALVNKAGHTESRLATLTEEEQDNIRSAMDQIVKKTMDDYVSQSLGNRKSPFVLVDKNVFNDVVSKRYDKLSSSTQLPNIEIDNPALEKIINASVSTLTGQVATKDNVYVTNDLEGAKHGVSAVLAKVKNPKLAMKEYKKIRQKKQSLVKGLVQ